MSILYIVIIMIIPFFLKLFVKRKEKGGKNFLAIRVPAEYS